MAASIPKGAFRRDVPSDRRCLGLVNATFFGGTGGSGRRGEVARDGRGYAFRPVGLPWSGIFAGGRRSVSHGGCFGMIGPHSRWIEAAHSGQLPPLVPSFLAVFGGRQIGAAQNGGGGSCFSQKQVRNACLSALRTRFLAHLSFRGRQWSFMEVHRLGLIFADYCRLCPSFDELQNSCLHFTASTW